MTELRRTPLHDRHVEAGAKLVPFGGWEMPLAYRTGTIAEHMACRTSAVVFDVSHLGTVRVVGDDAFDALQYAFTNDLRRIEQGRTQYTHLLGVEDGSVLDDIIVWWVASDRFDVMPNASNTERVIDALASVPGAVECSDVTSTRAVLAVQGPEVRGRLEAVSTEIGAVARFRVVRLEWNGIPLVVAGTGYTGEDGVEIAVPVDAAGHLWDAIVGAGIVPAGLGARDTLRLEAGLPLHGHELGPGITSLQAGLEWVVKFDKGDFRGRNALAAERATGPSRLLRGLVTEGRRPPREGQVVRLGDTEIGVVTSGNFSPVLGCGIALAFLPPDIEDGAEVMIEARGNELPARVTKPPFHEQS